MLNSFQRGKLEEKRAFTDTTKLKLIQRQPPDD